ncbi:hypothetical protein Tco_0467844 [Tanacetum coccineum]
MDLTKAGANRFLQINELDKIRLNAYESSISYKERTKRWYNKRINTPTKYENGDKVLLFNSCLRLFPGKLKSMWYGPFLVSKDMKNGAIKLYDENRNEFIVNKQRVKPYQKDVFDADKDDDITLEDEGENIFGTIEIHDSIHLRKKGKRAKNVESAKELWESLESKYLTDDASSKKFLKDFKHSLKHGKDDLSLVQLGSHLCIEESLRAHESDKGKAKEVVRPSMKMEEGGKN